MEKAFMRDNLKISRSWLCAGVAAAGLVMAAPALAQSVNELTVTGRIADLPEISAAVSYADLDLTTQAGQDELKRRVASTASDLCDKLGEGRSSGMEGVVPTCKTDAVNNTGEQVRLAIASATPRTAVAVLTPAPAEPVAVDATTNAAPASYTTSTVTNGPVPDTAENRSKYGQPMSRAGRMTKAAGN